MISRMVRGRTLAAFWCLALGAYVIVVRPWLLRWGASDEEVAGLFPGADIVPNGKRAATMAVTIEAPPERIWPWLAQMGYNRAGWYSWDRFDNGGRPSAERIHPEWEEIKLGDRLTAWSPGGTSERVGSGGAGAGTLPRLARAERRAWASARLLEPTAAGLSRGPVGFLVGAAVC